MRPTAPPRMPSPDRLILEILPPLAVWVLANGIDDLCVDWLWLRSRRARRAPPRAASPVEPRLALLIPCWHEAEVIGRMLEGNLAEIDYENYEIWVGVYPNDPECIEAVREVQQRHPRVRMAVNRRPGPTTKADCLNQVVSAILAEERATGHDVGVFLMHDAEDLIHRDEPRRAADLCGREDMVQFPVYALPTPLAEPTHGVYCDEFAESHCRDLPARAFAGGFVPSAGVGTALGREAIDRLRMRGGDRIFDPGSLTEDYVLGLRLRRMGLAQAFAADFGRGGPATRAYFPRTARAASRQRTRWVVGNCLQAWERYGWPTGQRYWLWRDRKGLINHPLAILTNALFLYGLADWGWAALGGRTWALGAALNERPALTALLLTNALLLAWRQFVRALCVGRIYGWAQALTVPLRIPWANAINAAATVRALAAFGRARLLGRPLFWSKTAHHYPDAEEARPS